MKYILQFFTLITVVLAIVSPSFAQQDSSKVKVQLDWIYQFQYAGFIAAQEKGFYHDVGLDVELVEYVPGLDTIEQVMSGKANYGINNSSIVVSKGKIVPLVLLATYLQQSPLVFISTPEITKPSDFLGKRLMGTSDELKYSSLALLLNHFDINKENTHISEHSFNINDFIENKVDIMSVFRSNQLYELDLRGIKYNIIDPADFGFYMSAVNVFSSKEEVLRFPERTQNFIDATNRGWVYAFNNTEELVDIIYNKYSKKKSTEALLYEAKIIKKMMLLDFYPIGETNEELSRRSLKQLQQTHILTHDDSLGTFLFHDLIQEYNQQVTWSPQEQQYMTQKGQFNLCVDPNWMPVEAIENGKYIGIGADIFKIFEKLLPIPITLVETNSWAESLKKIEDRSCDILSLAVDTRERQQFLHFTSSFIELPVVMATQTNTIFIENFSKLNDKRIGIVKDYAHVNLIREKNKNIKIIEVDSIDDGLHQVEAGTLFGYVDNLMVVASQIQHNYTGTLKISARLDEKTELAIGTRNDEPMLHKIAQTLVQHIENDQLQKIVNKWVPITYTTGFNYPLFIKLLFCFFLVVIAFAFHYYRLKQYSKKLKILSITDKLTGLHNRLKVDEVLSHQQLQVDRYNTQCGLILLDIDHFKNVNDTYGHQTGDRVLIEFANLLKTNMRSTDTVGRWGGEEFLIICPNIGPYEVQRVAEKLLSQIRDFSFHHGEKMTASMGVGTLRKNLSVAQNIDAIDRLMYQAKNRGRNRIECPPRPKNI